MAEMTDNTMTEALRYRANKEATQRAISDEDRIQEIADFIMVSSQDFDNEALRSTFSDIANQMTTNKSVMATGPGQQTPDAVGGVAPPAPPMDPGMMPPMDPGAGMPLQ